MAIKDLLHLGCWVKSRYLPRLLPGPEKRDKFYKVVCFYHDGSLLIETDDGWEVDPEDLSAQHIVKLPAKCWKINRWDIKEIKGYFSSNCM